MIDPYVEQAANIVHERTLRWTPAEAGIEALMVTELLEHARREGPESLAYAQGAVARAVYLRSHLN